MAANIRFTKKNMTVVDGYYFMFDETLHVLFEITSDGTTAFSYPLDTALDGPVISLEYDGTNFWTMEVGETVGQDIIIKRWLLDNYVCKLQTTHNYTSTVDDSYSSQAFTVEHYHTTVTGTYTAGDYSIGMVTGFSPKLLSGMTVTLGPNAEGYTETIAVAGSSDGIVVLQDPITHDYAADDLLQFYTDIWLFNDYSGSVLEGALYNLNAYSGSYITKYPGAVYSDINSATFSKVDSFSVTHGLVDSLLYVKASNLLFVDIEPSGGQLSYFGSMAMDNIAAGGASVYEIFDLAIDDQNIFRLQTVDGGNNYKLSTLNPLVSSIAIEASPAILPANEISTTTITAQIKDQFFQPVSGRLVTFEHNETSTGEIVGTNPVNSDADGIATISFRSGDEAQEVTIIATVDQS